MQMGDGAGQLIGQDRGRAAYRKPLSERRGRRGDEVAQALGPRRLRDVALVEHDQVPLYAQKLVTVMLLPMA